MITFFSKVQLYNQLDLLKRSNHTAVARLDTSPLSLQSKI